MDLRQIQHISKEDKEELKKKLIFHRLESPEELQAWLYLFLDIMFPMGVVYPTSTHAPIDAMWEIYRLMKTGESADCPKISMLSSRDSYKTLSAAALEVLMMIHFRISVAHMAAIKQQSAKAVQYINGFFRKLKPYLEHHGWNKISDSKTYIEWVTEENESVYLNIVTATVAGANCIFEDTVVETKDGPKLAKEVKQNDLLKSFDIWQQKEFYAPVLNVGKIQADCRELVFEDGSNIILSHKHKVFSKLGWINAGNLREGDPLIAGAGDRIYTKPDNSHTAPSWNLEEMIFGTLLANASVEKLSTGFIYKTTSDEKNLPYLENIQKTLELHRIEAHITLGNDGNYNLHTNSHDFFKSIYRTCYVNNKKQMNPMWAAYLNLETLAHLVMIGGADQTKEDSPIRLVVRLLGESDNSIFFNKIKKLGYDCKLENNILEFDIQSSRELSCDIDRYFVDCAKYKLLRTDNIRFDIDTGYLSRDVNIDDFSWDNKTVVDLDSIKIFKKKINKFLNKRIKSVKEIGERNIIGISIKKSEEFNKRCFYANGVLVHNSEHVPLLFIDEVDVVQDPRALEEAKLIPSVYKEFFPLTVYLSTRKFAGGLMEKTLKETEDSGGKILKWNILDVTERIPKEISKPEEERVIRYISTILPMENLSKQEWELLPAETRVKYEKIEAYSGIADHQMLSVMKNYLADRPDGDVGGLYKPLVSVLNNFKGTSPDMGEAQLLCNKPSSVGLVYPRFDENLNTLTVVDAIKRLSGDDREPPTDTFEYLKDQIVNLGIPIIGGADWGFSHYTALGVFALFPGGEVWQLDTLALPQLELPDIVKYATQFQAEWGVSKWFVDQNYPAYIKTLRRNGLKIPKFKKVVEDGIAAVQGQIVDSNNNRKFFIIRTPNNKVSIDAYGLYKWAVDGKGDVIEGKPYHDEDGVADIMDMTRYPFQNLFLRGGGIRATVAEGDSLGGETAHLKQMIRNNEDNKEVVKEVNKQIMLSKIGKLSGDGRDIKKIKKKGRLYWG